MIVRIALFVMMILGLGGFATVGWLSLRPAPVVTQPLANMAPVPPPVATMIILTAAKQVQGGTLLRPDDLASAIRPVPAIPLGAIADNPANRRQVFGAMARRTLADGEIILGTDFLKPGEHGFLAAILRPGMLAETIGVDPVSGIGGLVWPGDRVDAILTQVFDDKDFSQNRRIAAEVVLSNIRIVAIDQHLVEGTAPGSAEPQSRTATLELSPTQATRLSVAVKLGQISLALRAASAEPTAVITAPGSRQPARATATLPLLPHDGTTWAGDVSSALSYGQKGQGHLHVFDGNSDGKDFQF
ncbi:MAG: Flp pilus assembly protein CpaB [Janthinobacterium lividum]